MTGNWAQRGLEPPDISILALALLSILVSIGVNVWPLIAGLSVFGLAIGFGSQTQRTLSKEHGRQVVIAVHDRQLFNYLRLELSPAFRDDSLITLEMTRSVDRDSHCFSTRYSFQEETALRVA